MKKARSKAYANILIAEKSNAKAWGVEIQEYATETAHTPDIFSIEKIMFRLIGWATLKRRSFPLYMQASGLSTSKNKFMIRTALNTLYSCGYRVDDGDENPIGGAA